MIYKVFVHKEYEIEVEDDKVELFEDETDWLDEVENYDRSGHCSTLCKIKETDIGINFIG